MAVLTDRAGTENGEPGKPGAVRLCEHPEAPGGRHHGRATRRHQAGQRDTCMSDVAGEWKPAEKGPPGRVSVLCGSVVQTPVWLRPLAVRGEGGWRLPGLCPSLVWGTWGVCGQQGELRFFSSLAGFKISKWPILMCLRKQK